MCEVLIVFCVERPSKEGAPLGGGIELCGSFSCVGGLISLLCNGVNISIILIHIFNKYFEPYLLLTFNIICVTWNMKITILYPLKFFVQSCPYSIKISNLFHSHLARLY